MIQIKTIQTFRTLQVLNDNRKEKDTNFTFCYKPGFLSRFTVQWRRQENHEEVMVWNLWYPWLWSWVSAVLSCRGMVTSWEWLQSINISQHKYFQYQELSNVHFLQPSQPSLVLLFVVTNLKDIAGDTTMFSAQSGSHLCHCDQRWNIKQRQQNPSKQEVNVGGSEWNQMGWCNGNTK